MPSCSALHQVASLYLLIGLASGLGNATANTSLTWAWHGAAPQLAGSISVVMTIASLLLHGWHGPVCCCFVGVAGPLSTPRP